MKLMKSLFALTFLTGIYLTSFGQVVIQTESPTHIFWQSDRYITQEDFQGDCSSNQRIIDYCNKHGLCANAFVGLFAIIDIPKKKSKRGKLLEKVYFAPAFQKNTSCILKLDSLGIEKQQLLFDIVELSARRARKDLKMFSDSMPGYGSQSIMFKSVEAQVKKIRDELTFAYTVEVYIEEIPGAYNKWRKKVDELLSETEEFSTKPEDCYRFVVMKPIDKDYKEAKKIVGNLF